MRRKKTLNDEYFDWLYSLIRKDQLKSYITLLTELYNRPFKWFVRNDDNRCSDGLNLRDLYLSENRLDESHLEVSYFLTRECTILEMLIALAKRMDDLMYDLDDQDSQISKWFFEMLRNLRLTSFDDSYSRDGKFDPITDTKVDEILDDFVSRRYGFDGRGGLFPLKKQPRKDQAKVEIWYQLMAYLEEKH